MIDNMLGHTCLHIYEFVEHTQVLGPFDRFAIWVSGCCFNCEGCLVKSDMTHDKGSIVDCDFLSTLIVNSGCEGITISGGEPFLQARQLSMLINKVKCTRDVGVIVYTGFTLEELLGFSKPVFSEMLLSCTDLLIDGRYIKELDDSKTLRGSSNQRVLPLTERYLEYLGIYGVKGRKVEWKNLHGRRFMCGVPTQEQLAQFKKTV